jgi:hypothetical protein
MCFTAEEIVFLERNNFIPEKLKKEWTKGIKRSPIADAETVLWLESDYKSMWLVWPLIVACCLLLLWVESIQNGLSFALCVAGPVALLFNGFCLWAWIAKKRALEKAELEFSSGAGKDFYDLHLFVPGILRSGTDAKAVVDAYRVEMKVHAYETHTSGTSEAAAVMERRFELGTRFFLNPTLKGGWRQYLPKKAAGPEDCSSRGMTHID